MKEPYKIYRDSYVDRKTGERKQSPAHHVRFRDHFRRRQTLVAETRLDASVAIANRIMQLIECRRHCTSPDPSLVRWLDAQPQTRVDRLVGMDLIDSQWTAGDRLLKEHLVGVADADGNVSEPGFRQSLEARESCEKHVRNVVRNIDQVIRDLHLLRMADALMTGVEDRISVYLGQRRRRGEISGTTLNYIVRDLKTFGKWLHRTGRASRVPFEMLKRVDNAEMDTIRRRALSVEELRALVRSVGNQTLKHHALSPDERLLLYRFAFATGLRPSAIESLTVGGFVLDSDQPHVVTSARRNKRRQRHEQPIPKDLATELGARFAEMSPTDPAFRVPHDPAEMLRVDLAVARREWIESAENDKQRTERSRSDFLAEVNHTGEQVCFYSLRHAFGTALADAGIAQKDIAAAMHHSTTRTTERYLHSTRRAVHTAVSKVPTISAT